MIRYGLHALNLRLSEKIHAEWEFVSATSQLVIYLVIMKSVFAKVVMKIVCTEGISNV